MTDKKPKIVGVLALQGGFSEHINVLSSFKSITPIQIKTVSQLKSCDGLIIPGGESTAISLSIIRNDLLEPLKQFLATRPVWGTCAGLILLSRETRGNGKRGKLLNLMQNPS
jgi:pyridoxal 5'-phosphate synthase pdxT subunit